MRALLLLGLTACGGYEFDPDGEMPEKLSDLGLFTWEDDTFTYADDVVPYDLIVPLFSDHALKDRAIRLPEGQAAAWSDNDVLDFPVGTLLIKSFSFPADFRQPDQDIDLVETRILVNTSDGWEAWPYVWDEAMTDAELKVAGKTETITFLDEAGESVTFPYLVPQKNQCASCHEIKDDADDTYMTPIGPKARHLNRDGQLEAMIDDGTLTDAPSLDTVYDVFPWSEVKARGVADLQPDEVVHAARDYLDINCAHCHNPKGVNGITSQLFLNYDNTDDFHLGICKKPGSAGPGGLDRDYDIQPSDSYESILWYRMDTTELGAMMPQLGRGLTDDLASELIAAWIDAMPYQDCQAQQ